MQKNLMNSFSKLENFLTLFIFLRIFKITTSLSCNLQAEGLGMLQPLRMEESVESKLQKVSRDFNSLRKIVSESLSQ